MCPDPYREFKLCTLEAREKALNAKVEDTWIGSPRMDRLFRECGFKTISDVLQYSPQELKQMNKFWSKLMVGTLQDYLAEYGLQLNEKTITPTSPSFLANASRRIKNIF